MQRCRILAGFALFLLLAGCGGEPVLGKWSATLHGIEAVMEFRPDGTAAMELDTGTSTVAQLPRVKREIEKLRKTKLAWKKEGALYRLERAGGGPGSPPQYFKLEKDQLLPCTPDGQPNGQPGLRRKTAS